MERKPKLDGTELEEIELEELEAVTGGFWNYIQRMGKAAECMENGGAQKDCLKKYNLLM